MVWTAAFRGRTHFWQKMAVGVGALGALAVAANPELRSTRNRPRLRDIPVGLSTAAVLYGIFRVGDRFARRVMPTGAADIADVYERRRMAPRWFIAPALALVIAPGEELFWRGLVNGYLMGVGIVGWSLVGPAVKGGGGYLFLSGWVLVTGYALVAVAGCLLVGAMVLLELRNRDGVR